jgi:hypothetical protein
MRTTIDLPDDLLRQAKAKAALEGKKLKELIAEYVAQGLSSDNSAYQKSHRSKLPVARRTTGQKLPQLNNQDIQRLLDDEDVR